VSSSSPITPQPSAPMLPYSLVFALVYLAGCLAIGWLFRTFTPHAHGSSPLSHLLAVGAAFVTAWVFAKRHQRPLSRKETSKLVSFCIAWVLALEGLIVASQPQLLSLPLPFLLGAVGLGAGLDALIVWVSFRYIARRALRELMPEPACAVVSSPSWREHAQPYLLAPAIVLLLMVAGIVILKSGILSPIQVTVADIPHVLSKVSAASRTPAFAEFVFTTPDRPATNDAVHLRLSLENGHAGVDWVLVEPRNIEDKDAFVAFAKRRGYSLAERTNNGASYLRIEDGDLAEVCAEVITKLYFRPRAAPMELKVSGFDWDH